MRKILFVLFAFIPFILNAQLTFEDFETYAPGAFDSQWDDNQWTGWFGAFSNVSISDERAYSGNNSLKVEEDDDIVALIGTLDSEAYEISFMQYIPSENGGHFNLQRNYTNTAADWSVSVTISDDDPQAQMRVDLDNSGGVYLHVVHDEWVEHRIVADFETMTGTYYYDGLLIRDWPLNGEDGNSLNRLNAINFYGFCTDLFGSSCTALAYYDDIRVNTFTPTGYDLALFEETRISEYSVVPTGLEKPLNIAARVRNYGFNEATDVSVTFTVSDASGVVFTDTSPVLSSLAPDSLETFTVSNPYTPTGGAYTVEYTVNMNEEDEYPNNNTKGFFFDYIVDDMPDYEYARDDGNYTGGLGVGTLGHNYDFAVPVSVTAINTSLRGGAIGESIMGHIFSMNADGSPANLLASTPPVSIDTPGTSDAPIDYALTFSETVYLAAGEYLFAVEQMGETNIAISTSEDIFTLDKNWFSGNNGNTWEKLEDLNFVETMHIRPVLNGVDVDFTPTGYDLMMVETAQLNEYFIMPTGLEQPLDLQAKVRNVGINDATNVSVTFTVSDASGVVFTDTSSPLASLASGVSVDFTSSSSYTPTATGIYTVEYIVNLEEEEDYTTNNTKSASLVYNVDDVLDYEYARDDGNYSDGIGYNAPAILGHNYDFAIPSTITAIHMSSIGGGVGESIVGHIFSVNADGLPDALIASSDIVMIDEEGEFGSPIDYALYFPGGVALDAGNYFFGVEQMGNTNLSISTSESVFTSNTAWGKANSSNIWDNLEDFDFNIAMHLRPVLNGVGEDFTASGVNLTSTELAPPTEYTIVPTGLEQPLNLSTEVYNLGVNDATDVSVTFTVSNASGVVFTDTSPVLASLVPDAPETFTASNSYTPTGGTYTVEYTINSGENDDYIADNTTSATFTYDVDNIPDYEYARDNGDYINGLGFDAPGMLGHNYDLSLPSSITAINTSSRNGAIGESIRGHIFSISLDGSPNALIASTDPVTIVVEGSPNSRVDYTLNFPSPVYLGEGEYFFSVEQMGNTNLGISYSENIFTPNKNWFGDGSLNEWEKPEDFDFEVALHIRPVLDDVDVVDIENSVGLVNALSIFPNPTSGVFTFDIKLAETKDLNVEIYNAQGQLVTAERIGNTQGGQFTMNLSEVSSGIYFAKFLIGEQILTQQIMIQK